MGTKKAALSGPLADADIRLLRVFMAVVDAGGVSAAEIQLNLANSTISNYIADLERRLQMKLCRRGRAGFALTEQGHLVYTAAQQLLQALEGFTNTVNQAHNQLLGNLRLGFAEHMLSVHHTSVVQTLTAFSHAAPEVQVQISTLSSDAIATATLEDKVDVGITVLPHGFPELACQSLFNERMLLYCGEGHPLFNQPTEHLCAADLACHRFVESPRLMRGREPQADMRNWPIHAKAHHQEARTALILSGHYLGFLPQHLVENWGLKQCLQAIGPERYGYNNTFSAIWKPARGKDPLVKAFIDCLQPYQA